jgi:5,10-methylenetetrahydromethanopterin reductase
MHRLGVMLPVQRSAPVVVDLARRAEAAGVDELWVAEDLGLHGGVALATAVLAATYQVPVGLGIAPAAARNPAFLAMQAATLGQLAPGRFRLGIGHGMPDWMRAVGAWPRSSLARLEETIVVVRRLLAGEEVTHHGREVTIDAVHLTTAPVDVPLLAGVRGPRSLELAGRVADGVVLAGWSGPAYVERARATVTDAARAAGRDDHAPTVVASARFALDGGDPTTSATERLLTDLARAGTSIDAMLPDPGQDPSADPAQLLGEVAITGDDDALRAGIDRWAAAGADVVLLDPLSVDDLELALAADLR